MWFCKKTWNQSPVATMDVKSRPEREFATGRGPLLELWEREPGREGSPAFQIQYAPDKTPATAFCHYKKKLPSDSVATDDLRMLADAYPELREIFGCPSLTDESLDGLRQFKNLQVLSCGTIELTPDGIGEFKKMNSLQILQGYSTVRMSNALQLALPDCELHLTLIEEQATP